MIRRYRLSSCHGVTEASVTDDGTATRCAVTTIAVSKPKDGGLSNQSRHPEVAHPRRTDRDQHPHRVLRLAKPGAPCSSCWAAANGSPSVTRPPPQSAATAWPRRGRIPVRDDVSRAADVVLGDLARVRRDARTRAAPPRHAPPSRQEPARRILRHLAHHQRARQQRARQQRPGQCRPGRVGQPWRLSDCYWLICAPRAAGIGDLVSW